MIERFNYRVGKCKGDQTYQNNDLESFARHSKDDPTPEIERGAIRRLLPRKMKTHDDLVSSDSFQCHFLFSVESLQQHPQLSKQPSFLLSTSPTSPAETPQSSCELLLTWCALQEPSPLSSLSQLLAAIPSEPSPI
jgi:hypothetical protein